MNIKLTALSAGILVAISTAASAVSPPTVPTPPSVPDMYNQGPQYPNLNTTNLSVAEKSGFALYEGVMQVTEAKIHATSCANASFDLEVYADGKGQNYVKVTGSNGSLAPQFQLNATPQVDVPGRGQHVLVKLAGTTGTLGSTGVSGFSADYVYNNVKNMMVTNSVSISVLGGNGVPDSYTGNVIKDFYHGATAAVDTSGARNPEYYNIYDWGLQSISKLGYPVEKWWQRSKTHRDDGIQGRTVWVKDRLVGPSECRITIDTSGYNNANTFWQGGAIGVGTLTIQPVLPTALVNPITDPNDPTKQIDAWLQEPFNQ